MVEGNTDTTLIRHPTPCVEDNWDLSLKRAQAVGKIFLDDGISPNRLILAGRGEYNPVNSPGNLNENRRTTVVVLPLLDTLGTPKY